MVQCDDFSTLCGNLEAHSKADNARMLFNDASTNHTLLVYCLTDVKAKDLGALSMTAA